MVDRPFQRFIGLILEAQLLTDTFGQTGPVMPPFLPVREGAEPFQGPEQGTAQPLLDGIQDKTGPFDLMVEQNAQKLVGVSDLHRRPFGALLLENS